MNTSKDILISQARISNSKKSCWSHAAEWKAIDTKEQIPGNLKAH